MLSPEGGSTVGFAKINGDNLSELCLPMVLSSRAVGVLGTAGVTETTVACECRRRCAAMWRDKAIVSSTDLEEGGGKFVIWNSAGGGSFPNSYQDKQRRPRPPHISTHKAIAGAEMDGWNHHHCDAPEPSCARAAR